MKKRKVDIFTIINTDAINTVRKPQTVGKYLITLAILMICIFVTVTESHIIKAQKYPAAMLKSNIPIELQSPKNRITVASNIWGLPADGDVYRVFEYDDKGLSELMNLNIWGKPDENINHKVSELINNLKTSPDVSARSKSLIDQYVPFINKECMYFYKEVEDDWVILILNISEKRVSVLESYH